MNTEEIEQWKTKLGEKLWEGLRTTATPSALIPVLSMLSKHGISFKPEFREESDHVHPGPPFSDPALGCTLVENDKPCGEPVTADGACYDHCRPCPHCGEPIRQQGAGGSR
jgi:hypothetical protein